MADYSSPETAARVLSHLTETPTASARDIAEAVGISRQTSLNAVRRLLDEGSITITRKGTGYRYPTTYAVLGS